VIRPRDTNRFVWGLVALVVAFLLALGHVNGVALVIAARGTIDVIASFFLAPGRRRRPGPLDATPTGRFRATGWPPSKDPDAYR
jgi:hypothetical protein